LAFDVLHESLFVQAHQASAAPLVAASGAADAVDMISATFGIS
jgi:hypothetical protein